jgi:uncharacterized protein with PIN domain
VPTLHVALALRLFLPPDRRRGAFTVAHDGTSSLGHVVEAVGIPLTEVGTLRVGGVDVAPAHRPAADDDVEVEPVARPQRVPSWDGRFLLDVHLGSLARRLRILGLDAAYPGEVGDAALVARANAERRLLLTRDRGLLKRRALWAGAYVRGSRSDDQVADVVDRFAPPLRPWTRCTACNGPVEQVDTAEVAAGLQPGTLRNHDRFARCRSCGQVYWRGAHARRLDRIVRAATRSDEFRGGLPSIPRHPTEPEGRTP